ncbi:interleukin-18-binding protein isoform X3 [Pithys albifrons albifrons]|uniref:interleukin-18-binding protein isoform X3 n=1 Tax=Pithys albifrons albifrons TaxID=3385563 RepID=UPI003A5CD85D
MAEPRSLRLPRHPACLLLLLPCWTLAIRCAGAMALQLPRITILRMPAEQPHPGESVTVSCEATSELPELTLLYWLGNGSFVESLHPDGAVREGTVQEEPQGSGVTLRRDLHFSSFDTQHLHTNFTCVVLSPLGVDTREVQWPLPAPAPVTIESGDLGSDGGETHNGRSS